MSDEFLRSALLQLCVGILLLVTCILLLNNKIDKLERRIKTLEYATTTLWTSQAALDSTIYIKMRDLYDHVNREE